MKWGTETYMAGDEDGERSNFSEEPHLINGAYDSVDLAGKKIAVSFGGFGQDTSQESGLTVSPLKGRHTTAL